MQFSTGYILITPAPNLATSNLKILFKVYFFLFFRSRSVNLGKVLTPTKNSELDLSKLSIFTCPINANSLVLHYFPYWSRIWVSIKM
jgi:hypothetical protein